MFMTSLEDPSKVIARPGGHIISPRFSERVGDVSNVTFTNGWVPWSVLIGRDGKVVFSENEFDEEGFSIAIRQLYQQPSGEKPTMRRAAASAGRTVVLGGGKRIFRDDGALSPLQLVNSQVRSTGVSLATYASPRPDIRED
jgi:hypothetical protein